MLEPARSVSRRGFGRALLGVLASSGNSLKLVAQEGLRNDISQFDLSLLYDRVTPSRLFFIRSHLPVPKADANKWAVSISGAVAEPLTIALEGLVRLPVKRLAATIECAENPVGGGMVSNAEWSGAGLGELLGKVRPLPNARVVRLAGSDGYERVIPFSKAMHPDTVVAYLMNEEKLPPMHGGPLRVLLPGWYGMDSVKWLKEVELLAGGENRTYVRLYRDKRTAPITEISVKAVFARPLDAAVLSRRRFVIRGAAWAGEKKVTQVQVSTDGGSSWGDARLIDAPIPYAWVRWELLWLIPKAGEYELVVRARDDGDRTQPGQRDSSRLDEYEQVSWERIRVGVV